MEGPVLAGGDGQAAAIDAECGGFTLRRANINAKKCHGLGYISVFWYPR